MRKGKKNENFGNWKRCAKLAIAWNNSEIARNSIFNTENRRYWQVCHLIVANFVTETMV